MLCSNKTYYDYHKKGFVPYCACSWVYGKVYSSSRIAGLVADAHIYGQKSVPKDLDDMGELPQERLKRIFEARRQEERQRLLIAAEELEVIREEAAMILDSFLK